MVKPGTILLLLVSAWTLQGCLDGASTPQGSLLVEGDFPVVFVKREMTALGNPTDGARFAAGGDLMIKDLSSPSSETRNITASMVTGPHDVSDPEVSWDGRRVLFSMRAPEWGANTTWNLFEYDTATGALSRLVQDEALANAGDDVDPAYLPDGRIVFTSNRQKSTLERMQAEGRVQPYKYRDEYEREATMVLHVLDPAIQQITQISVNQSHDRNPTVLMSGQVMFARWEHAGNRNHFPLFTADPDGTNIFVQYGAFSPGNSYLHPREMPDGRVLTSLMPLLRTNEGGALMIVDVKNFIDDGQPASDGVAGRGQVQARPDFPVPLGREYSVNGRYTTPYPLWDGTNRALVAFRPNPAPEDALLSVDPMTGMQEVQENPPRYGIYMLDLDSGQLRPIDLPDAEGSFAYTDPVPLIPRDGNCLVSRPDGCVPAIVPDLRPVASGTVEKTLADQGMAILNVKSVYDTDGQGLMGPSMLVPGESIPQRNGSPDLAAMKTPGTSAYAGRVARFIRVSRAVPTPPGMSRDEIGTGNFEMQEILGYAPIEPDGSLRIKVPADTPIGIVVVDSKGRAVQTHTNWIQARPGETRTCNGCHSPRRGSAINGAGIAGNHPGTLYAGQSNESMAETRTRMMFEQGLLDTPAMELGPHMRSTTFWTQAQPVTELEITYDGLAVPPRMDDGVITINYQEHIQPLWEQILSFTGPAGEQRCVDCHYTGSPVKGPDLTAGIGGLGRAVSYQELVEGKPVLDAAGLPVVTVGEDGEVMIQRETPMVMVGSSRQSSRSSHLMEVLFNTELRAPQELGAGLIDHSGMFNDSELRLIAEWIDLGAQYRNDPFVATAGDPGSEGGTVKTLNEIYGGLQGLSETLFETQVQPVLSGACAGCHQAFGNTGGLPDLDDPNPGFASGNRFVLTGSVEGDFNITVGMVSDVCAGPANALLQRPSMDGTGSPGNPVHPLPGGQPLLPPGSTGYNVILGWIDAAADANGC